MTSWASFADGLRPLQSFWHPCLMHLVPCFLCCVQFVPLCQQPQLQTELSFLLSFLLSFRQTSRSQPPAHVFVLRIPSLQSTWLLQRSVTVRCTSCCFCVTPFNTSSVLCCCSSRNRFLNSAAFHSSTSISSSVSAWCSLAFSATFNSSSVSRHRSSFFFETLFSSYV